MTNLGAIAWTTEFVAGVLKLKNDETEKVYEILSERTEKELNLVKALCYQKDIETLKDKLSFWEGVKEKTHANQNRI